ncbi:MAG: agmatinase [Blastocatellia bacterium]|nr:agmatinase [Blastocatellia bacterium]
MQPSIIDLPWDEMSSFLRGAAEAPGRIRAAFASESANLWSESGVDFGARPIHDGGAVALSGGTAALAEIEAAIGALLDQGRQPISLGGDHAVTYPVLRAFAKRYPRLSILHFDAHPDLYDEFEGNRYSHACPFARILEEGLVERLVQVGIRTMTGHQRAQIERFGVEVVEMKDWRDDWPIDFDTPVYVSFDIDGLDPAFAPGVSHPEPGGLSTRQAINAIHSISAPVVGADIVEYNPSRDLNDLTAMVCAKLLKELAAKIAIGADWEA